MMFSIITVVLNEKEALKNTIQSVKEQKYQDYEYIVVDGKSTDGTLEIIRGYKQRMPQLIYISEKDDGIYDAMNKGIGLAKGEYVLFLGAGDVFYNTNVLQQVAHYKGHDIIYGYGIFSSGIQVGEKIGCKLSKIGILLDHCVAHQATYTKSELLKKYPFNEKYKAYADQDFLIHMYKIKKNFYYINQPLCYYDGTGFSSREENRIKYLDDHLKIMKQYYPCLFYFRLLIRKIKKVVGIIK